MNNCIFMGGIVRDAELSHTASGTAIAKFAIANSTGYGDKKETNYFDCILWGKQAEGLAKHLTKGKQIVVLTEARQNRWEQDGQKRSKIEFHVQKLDFQQGNAAGGQAAPKQQPKQDPEGFADDEIPW